MFNLVPNVLLSVAALLTALMGVTLFAPLPAGPDRAMIGLGCSFAQTPRWICMAFVLGACVARGAFTWPADHAAQYMIVFAVHALLGLGCLAAGLAGLGMTSGVPGWMSRVLAIGTIVVPAVQIVFAAWFLNPALHRNLDAATMRNVTNSALIAFAIVAGAFGLFGGITNYIRCAHVARSRARFEAEEAAKNTQKSDAEDKNFQALTAESPLADWIFFLASANAEAHRQAAREAILKRPTLVADLRSMIISTNSALANKAMRFVSETPKPPAEIADTVRERARFVVGVAEAIDPNLPDSRQVLYSRVAEIADGVRRAAWGLFRAGADLRPELRSIAEACGPREKDYPRDISDECSAMIMFISDVEKQNAVTAH